MKSAMVMLGTISDVKEFVKIISGYDFEIDLVSGRYAVDAKSIMGIFSLDLSRPIKVEAHTEDAYDFFSAIGKFIVE